MPPYRCLDLCDRMLDLFVVADVCVDPRVARRARCIAELATVREYLVQRRERLDIPTTLVLASRVIFSKLLAGGTAVAAVRSSGIWS